MICDLKTIGNTCLLVVLLLAAAFGLNGCSDVSKAPAPAPGPAALTISSPSPLPSSAVNIPYSTQLAASGGKPGYTWSLAAGSPALPTGLSLSTDGAISGTPTTIQSVSPIFVVQDSTSPTPQVVQATLTISINALPQPSISNPPSLPNGVVGTAYNATLTATGGTPPYTDWTVNPPLPSPLIFTPAGSTATISGTPTATSNGVTHTFSVTDSFSPTPQTGTRNYTLTITAAPLPLTIATSSLPPGTVTVPYPATTLAASGGTPPYTWSTVGNLAPAPGLLLSASGATAGQITGTPSSNVGSPFTRTYRVTDSVGVISPDKALSITISLPAPPIITTTSLPNGNFNQSYNQTLQLSGGTAPFFWSFNGLLPPGLGLSSSTGVISGTATQTGTFNFSPQVVDATLQTDPTPPALSITIVTPTFLISTPSLPIGTINQTYPITTLQAMGGTPPYTWDPVVSPALPNGLSWTSATGTISGTPLAGGQGTANHTFTVRDSTNPVQMIQKALSLTINAALTINEASLPVGTVGQTYNATLTASGGAPPYTWSILGTGTPNQAAPGLTLSSGGVISGTPSTAVGSPFTRTYQVQDSNAVTVTKSLALKVNAVLTIDTTSPLPNGKFGDGYGTVTPNTPVTLRASGGTPPYTWSTTVTPGLPDGLSIDAGGMISGTPKTIEANVFHTFTVTDSAGTPATASTPALSLTIAPP